MTDILLPLLQVAATTLFLGLLFAAAGSAVHAFAFPGDDPPESLFRWASGFFVGVYLYFFLFRTTAQLLGAARPACYLSLLVLLALAVRQRRTLTLRAIALTVAGLLAVACFNSLRYLGPLEHLDVFSSFGSLHGGRYSNVGLYILNENQVPRLTQNYGQSLLVGTQLFLGSPGPVAALGAWLALSQGLFILLLFALFRRWQLPPTAAVLGTFFVLFCNVTLSTNYIYLIDSGSPIIYTGYTDTTAALATWLILLEWLRADAERKPRHLLLLAVLAYGWSLTGPQNFVITMAVAGPVVAAMGAYLIVMRVRLRSHRVEKSEEPHRAALAALVAQSLPRVILATAVVGVAFALGSAQGGMFVPKPWATDTGLPGMMTVQARGESAIMAEQAFAFRENGKMYWWFQLESKDFPPGRFHIETHLWTALRLLFFPLAGIVALAVLRGFPDSPNLNARGRDFWLLTAMASLFPGFLASFWFIYHGYKWELGRFLLPGILTGLVALVIAVNAIRGRGPRLGVWLWSAMLLLGSAGPLSQVAESIAGNHLSAEARAVPISARLRLLLTPDPIPERYPPYDPSEPLGWDDRK